MVTFLTFANEKFYDSQIRIGREAKESGFFDKIILYKDKDLEESYKKKYENFIESNPRGYGYWIWKSHIIRKTLQSICDNDYLIYLDCGCEINRKGKRRFSEYLRFCDKSETGIVAFSNGYIERCWDKGDVIDFFHVRNHDKILNGEQIMGGIMIIKKMNKSLDLISQWESIVHNNLCLVTDAPSESTNLEGFIENRHDQSVFSLLCKTYSGICVLPSIEVEVLEWQKKNWSSWYFATKPFYAARTKTSQAKYLQSSYSRLFIIDFIRNIIKPINRLRVQIGAFRRNYLNL